MAREPITETIAGLEVTSLPLPFAQAEPLLPEVGQFVALVFEELANALDGVDLKSINLGTLKVNKLLGAIRTASMHLGEGKLAKLAPKITATTSVICEDLTGEKVRRDLGNAKDRNAVFDAYPEAYLPILWMAGRATFGRFFSAAALTGGETSSASS